ncbi:MAG: hypothetical protein DRG24_01020 [Epsilonproteobacteria bacterium]|nr:MAG: hypothetical protein DRG24_01020 [Campylobacterota bacterium]
MIFSYIRPDKHFTGAFDQLKLINAYVEQKEIRVDEEMIDQTSQNNRLSERGEAVAYFRAHEDDTLLIYDLWVLSSNIEDVVQLCSCLLKNNMQIHIISNALVINRDTDVMVLLGLIDHLRQTLHEKEKKLIGRPKGSRSSSKFDQYLDKIVTHLRNNKSVSEIARLLGVSRSSLKDYIESRELKEVIRGSNYIEPSKNMEENLINTIECPTIEEKETV